MNRKRISLSRSRKDLHVGKWISCHEGSLVRNRISKAGNRNCMITDLPDDMIFGVYQ